jgi:hypothetical protein
MQKFNQHEQWFYLVSNNEGIMLHSRFRERKIVERESVLQFFDDHEAVFCSAM